GWSTSGPRRDGTAWPIGVQDPRGGDWPLTVLLLTSGGVATSGRDYRRWRQGNAERHHIIDPRTGMPAETDLLSVTVVAARVAEAEIAAKAVLILGSDAGLAWLRARPWLAGLLVRTDGAVLRTQTLEPFLWSDGGKELR
ncbi:MAG: FAD:protein FMN transferase, partial [Chloroflexaceae bacterium]